MDELSDRLQTWRAAGRFARIDGVQLWYRVSGRNHRDRPWLICFHGFPTSSWDWHRLLPLLQHDFRLLIFDFPGYGLSGKPAGRDYSLLRQFDTAERLLGFLGITEFHLLAHDMGDTVACELLYRWEQQNTALRPASVTLLNGGICMDLHRPLPTQRLLRTPVVGELTARLASWRVFRHQYPRVYARPTEFSEAHYRDQWALMLNNEGRRTLAKVAVYMKERMRYEKRWLRPLYRLQLPLQLVWGLEDPVAVPAIAARVAENNPRADMHLLAGIGHYPQLENADFVAKALKRFIFH